MYLFQRNKRTINDTMKGEGFIIHYLFKKNSEVQPSEISCEMLISSARITAALNNLQSKGLIRRKIDKNDRRKILVSLTDSGREFAENHFNEIKNDFIKMLKILGENDASEFVRIMRRLSEISTDKVRTEEDGK